ncbi:MAG: HAD family hydrolase [Nanobdellota archaeon]
MWGSHLKKQVNKQSTHFKEGSVISIKIISFDLDNTISTSDFDRFFWDEKLIDLYAKRHNLSLSKARSFVITDTSSLKDAIGWMWFDPEFWFYRYDLFISLDKIITENNHLIITFEDAKQIIPSLYNKGYTLVLSSFASEKLVKAKLEKDNLQSYFSGIFLGSNQEEETKSTAFFSNLLLTYSYKPSEILHVGDDIKQDYIAPKKAGIKTVLLDRNKKHLDVTDRIESLAELPSFLDK